MDSWFTRLIGGSSKSPKKKKAPNLNIPQQRLEAFKAHYSEVLHIWQNGNDVPRDAITAETIRILLSRLADLISDDLRGPTPHPCVSFVATNRLPVTVSRIASSFLNDGIIHEALSICNLLIDCEEEGFLEDRSFADAITSLVTNVSRSGVLLAGDLETESLMVEVLFTIASRARLEPHILPIWFRPKALNDESESEKGSNIASEHDHHGRGTGLEEFPLFHLLLHHVAHKGRAGEFGRMGVLYIIESASRSAELEKWIVESDTATFIASSLGALYSQLSRKLVLSFAEKETPAILDFSETRQPNGNQDGARTTSEEYQVHLETFLAYLMFWQDILEHCTSVQVKQTLLDHFQYLFLQQLLYPSLLESSDGEGGSSVAVLTYLHQMLEQINHPDLVGSILAFLLGSSNQEQEPEKQPKRLTLADRRKSKLMIDHHAHKRELSPDLFTLVDLIISSLNSKSQQTVAITFQLCSTLLRKQHTYTLTSLFKLRRANSGTPFRSISAHTKNVDTLIDIAKSLSEFGALEAAYEEHLHDVRESLESHPCSLSMLALPGSGTWEKVSTVPNYLITLSDSMLEASLDSLRSFFANDVETNLASTQVIADLACCGRVRLEHWLITTSTEAFDFMESLQVNTIRGQDSSNSPKEYVDQPITTQTLRPPTFSNPECLSPIFRIVDELIGEVAYYRQSISSFDALLYERKQSLLGPSSEEPALNPDLANALPPYETRPIQIPLSPASKLPPSPTRQSKNQNSIPASLFLGERLSEKNSSPSSPLSVSRSSSPRGRPPHTGPPPTPISIGRLTHLNANGATSRSPNGPATSRGYSPSPLRDGRANLGLGTRSSASMTSKTGTVPVPSQDGESTKTRERISSPIMHERVLLYDRSAFISQKQHSTEAAKILGGEESSSLFPNLQVPTGDSTASAESDTSSLQSEIVTQYIESRNGSRDATPMAKDISVGQLLTNVIILQEFLLELAAIIEVRGSIFGEVTFD
ncbi:hypothetical protein MMC25_002016 [Agyrium rufum]|nr:hypothetical protein [Agyrium rufum]